MQDSFLVQQVIGGNRNAFKLIVTRYQKPIFRFISAFGFPTIVVDEIAQETFLKAFKNLQTFDANKSAFSTWLFTIAKNTSINNFAKEKKRARLEMEPDHAIELNTPQTFLEKKDNAQKLREAMQRIPMVFRSALTLSYFQELSLEEIAVIEQSSLGTIKSRIFRGKELLRVLLIKRE